MVRCGRPFLWSLVLLGQACSLSSVSPSQHAPRQCCRESSRASAPLCAVSTWNAPGWGCNGGAGVAGQASWALRLRGGQNDDQYERDTSASIFGGTMPQDVSSEDEDQHLIDALCTRNHVLENADATELEKTVKETIRMAKIEDGSLPNPRYMNLTAAQERQLELDELLWFAAEHGELDLARQALQDGANISSTNDEFYNQTALHCATQFLAGHPAMVELLVEHGADVNARNCHNNTPMHEAAYWGYSTTVAKLLQLGADAFALNAINLTPLLNAEGNWQGVSRPCVGLHDMTNHSMLLWEHPTQSGWRHRLRAPEQRREAVDLLLDAMGNQSYGRGDPYCGGTTFPDLWKDWDEEGEHYNPLSRPREFKHSVPPFRTPFQDAKPKESFGFAGEKDIDEDIDRIWQRDKKQYYEQFPDESFSVDDKAKDDYSSSVDAGKDEGEIIRPDAATEGEFDMPNDGMMGGPEVDDDGADEMGAVQDESSQDDGQAD